MVVEREEGEVVSWRRRVGRRRWAGREEEGGLLKLRLRVKMTDGRLRRRRIEAGDAGMVVGRGRRRLRAKSGVRSWEPSSTASRPS